MYTAVTKYHREQGQISGRITSEPFRVDNCIKLNYCTYERTGIVGGRGGILRDLISAVLYKRKHPGNITRLKRGALLKG